MEEEMQALTVRWN